MNSGPFAARMYWKVGDDWGAFGLGRQQGGEFDGSAAFVLARTDHTPDVIHVMESDLIDLAIAIQQMHRVGAEPMVLAGSTGLIIARNLHDVERYR